MEWQQQFERMPLHKRIGVTFNKVLSPILTTSTTFLGSKGILCNRAAMIIAKKILKYENSPKK